MMIKWIDSKLIEWGDYMRDYNGLGYPTSSIEHRMKQGCFGGGSNTSNDGYMPNSIEKVETAVLELPQEEQAAVTVAYTTGGTRTQQAKRLSMRFGRRVSRDGFNKLISQSHVRLDGIFIGMKKTKRKW